MTDTKLYYCQGCNDHYPEARFEFYVDCNGRRAPRKQCRVCNGELGHKVCATCHVDKPIDKFKSERKPGRRFPLSYNKHCWTCIYARRKQLGTIGYVQKPKRRKELAPRANAWRPPGWTPPPTAEQLAAIHRNSKPWPGFARPKGEQCA